MKRVLIYVEGQTEETFINRIINPHINNVGVLMIPIIAATKTVAGRPFYKGGYISYAKTKREIKRLLGDSNAAAVTTMFDYFSLPGDFPGKGDIPGGNCYDRVKNVENKFYRDIDNRRFIPYLNLHEFEALVLASPEHIAEVFPVKNILSAIQNVTENVKSPEEINEGQDTHPSARLISMIPNYRKVLHGFIIAKGIGLRTIREKCPHFNEWLTKIEELEFQFKHR
jgi:hypothetical protein